MNKERTKPIRKLYIEDNGVISVQLDAAKCWDESCGGVLKATTIVSPQDGQIYEVPCTKCGKITKITMMVIDN